MRRCKSDPRYCYASHFKVISEQGGLVDFGQLYPAPRELQDWMDECLTTGRPARGIILKARRHRISTWAQAAIHHSCLFNRNRNAVVCAHDEDTSKLIFRMQETFFNNLPDFLRPMKRRASVGELVFDNPSEAGRITSPGLNSRVQIRTAGGAGRKAGLGQGSAGVGRGDRIDLFHGSEIAFWPNGHEVFRGFAQAVPEAPGTAILLESTANGQGGFFYDLWRETMNGSTGYTPFFFAWHVHPEYTGSYLAAHGRPEMAPTDDELSIFTDWALNKKVGSTETADRLATKLKLDEEEQLLALHQDVDWDQLKWRRWAIRSKCGGRMETFDVEYPSSWQVAFASSGTPRFDNRKVQVWMKSIAPYSPMLLEATAENWEWTKHGLIDPFIRPRGDHRGQVHMLTPPLAGHAYVIGGDAAHGLGLDSSAAVVFDATDNSVAAWVADPYMKPEELAEHMLHMAWYYNRAIIAQESNAPGNLTVHYLTESNYPWLYFRQRFDVTKNRHTAEPGFKTDQRTRELIISYFDGLIVSDAIKIQCKEILEQITTFVYDKQTGRADHLDGCHDDLLFSLMIAAWVAHHEKPERPDDIRGSDDYWSIEPPKDENAEQALSEYDSDDRIQTMLELFY